MFAILWAVACRGPCSDTTVGAVEIISLTSGEFTAGDLDGDGVLELEECLVVCDGRTSMAVEDCSVTASYPETGRHDLECTGTMEATCSIE